MIRNYDHAISHMTQALAHLNEVIKFGDTADKLVAVECKQQLESLIELMGK